MNLIKIEWLKLKHYKPFYLLGGFFFLGVFAANYLTFKITNTIKQEEAGKMLLDAFKPYQFEYVWQTTSYVSSYLLVIPAMLIILFTTNEYSFKTNRQHIIDGWSREQYISSKLQLVALMAFFCTLAVLFTGIFYGSISPGKFSFQHFENIVFFFIKAISYLMIGLLFAVLFKKNKIVDLGSMGDYLPMNASDGLLRFPKNPLTDVSSGMTPSFYPAVITVFAVFYLVLVIGWIVRLYMKRDL